jgi:hypothetical protein
VLKIIKDYTNRGTKCVEKGKALNRGLMGDERKVRGLMRGLGAYSTI